VARRAMACDRRVLLVIVAISVAGCGLFRSRPAEPKPFEVELVAADRLNPDEHGQSLPTVVHIYQLKSAVKLERADAERIYRAPGEALGADLLQGEEITLSPGEKLGRRLERERSARVLAVVALFRRPTGSSWRAIVELPPPTSGGKLRFLVEGYRVDRR
jgi:type VI secretion system VasD/TssJ family lipoprotein